MHNKEGLWFQVKVVAPNTIGHSRVEPRQSTASSGAYIRTSPHIHQLFKKPGSSVLIDNQSCSNGTGFMPLFPQLTNGDNPYAS